MTFLVIPAVKSEQDLCNEEIIKSRFIQPHAKSTGVNCFSCTKDGGNDNYLYRSPCIAPLSRATSNQNFTSTSDDNDYCDIIPPLQSPFKSRNGWS